MSVGHGLLRLGGDFFEKIGPEFLKTPAGGKGCMPGESAVFFEENGPEFLKTPVGGRGNMQAGRFAFRPLCRHVTASADCPRSSHGAS